MLYCYNITIVNDKIINNNDGIAYNDIQKK